jgi:hypothetical protein
MNDELTTVWVELQTNWKLRVALELIDWFNALYVTTKALALVAS